MPFLQSYIKGILLITLFCEKCIALKWVFTYVTGNSWLWCWFYFPLALWWPWILLGSSRAELCPALWGTYCLVEGRVASHLQDLGRQVLEHERSPGTPGRRRPSVPSRCPCGGARARGTQGNADQPGRTGLGLGARLAALLISRIHYRRCVNSEKSRF